VRILKELQGTDSKRKNWALIYSKYGSFLPPQRDAGLYGFRAALSLYIVQYFIIKYFVRTDSGALIIVNQGVGGEKNRGIPPRLQPLEAQPIEDVPLTS
jgi:hypothetical protein